MLKTDDSWKSTKCFGVVGEYDHKKHLQNIQTIEEKLLRLSVKWCDIYATDIVYLLQGLETRFLKENVTEVDIYFYNSGVNWLTNKGGSDNIPKYYRGMGKLVFEEEENRLTLYWRAGNC